MKIDYIYEQGAGRLNEDALSLNGSLFGVFDGATSLNKHKFENGFTGGFIASTTAKEVFAENNDTLTNLAIKANDAIKQKMIRNLVDITDKESLWSTSAAVVKIDGNEIEWLQIGDSLVMLIYKDGSFKIPVKQYDHDSETLMMWKSMAHKTSDHIFQALNHQIKKVRSAMNVDYGVLNGEKEFSDFINSGKENLSDVSHVLLFTDGLFIPSENPAEKNDFKTFVDLFHQGGLTEIRDHVRTIEQSDPECRLYPRFKPHDDIAAVSLSNLRVS
jgi:serine/threonine protein phosphatase PrpC